MAMNTHRQLGINTEAGAKSVEKLSSGFRINRAGDDAAGLAISEKMRGQIRGLDQASRNSQDAISLIQTAEGALNESHAILQRMRELSVQSANDTNLDADRTVIQSEVDELVSELDRIANNTEFNEKKLLSGNLGGSIDQDSTNTTVLAVVGVASVTSSGAAAGTYTVASTAAGAISLTDGTTTQLLTGFGTGATTVNFSEFGISINTNAGFAGVSALAADTIDVLTGAATFHIGANAGQNMDLAIRDMTGTGAVLGLTGIDIGTQAAADTSITTIDDAIKEVSSERATLGSKQNRLEHTIKNLDTSAENLQASESRIRDVDMAKEMMEFTKNNILQQAAQSMLAQANQAPQGVLQLLR